MCRIQGCTERRPIVIGQRRATFCSSLACKRFPTVFGNLGSLAYVKAEHPSPHVSVVGAEDAQIVCLKPHLCHQAKVL